INPCQSSPCQNGATCLRAADSYEYFCLCPQFFDGVHCEEELHPCDSSPCQNGATCLSSTDGLSFYCQCTGIYQGTQCEQEINPCDNVPCRNSGICLRVSAIEYVCSCQPPFTGSNCQAFDLCALQPCQNGATCFSENLTLTCICPDYYEGQFCEIFSPTTVAATTLLVPTTVSVPTTLPGATTEISASACLSDPCRNRAPCLETENRYFCICLPGFSGVQCEIGSTDPCDSNPCQNQAPCVTSDDTYLCLCTEGFSGTQCEIAPNPCLSNPCLLGSTCNNFVTTFTCDCLEGFAGDRCQTVTPCASNPCQNGATCLTAEDHSSYRCLCPSPQFIGSRCEIELDPCVSDPCQNSGICVNFYTFYQCLCPTGYSGNECQFDPCADNLCVNEANCFVVGSSYLCECLDGWQGAFCDVAQDPCISSPCLNQATCLNTGNTYLCQCASGYLGVHCEITLEPCDSKPCLNGGSCYINPGSFSYICICPEGYQGNQCQTESNPCSSMPCLNGATCFRLSRLDFTCQCRSEYAGDFCEQGGRSFFCDCPDEWTGETCQTEDLGACVSSPCQNGAPCVPTSIGYQCVCPDGFICADCDIVLPEDHCESAPCQNSGSCSNQGNGKTLGGVMEIPSSGSIVVESPGYPLSYPNNSFTKWTITAGSPNVRLRGAVQDLQTDSIGDYLEIFDGNVTEVTRRRRRRRRQSQLLLLSGEVTEQQTFESSGRIITVLFVSDSEGMGRGFSLTVEGVPEVTGPCSPSPCLNGATCLVQSPTKSTCQCRTGYYGVLCDRVGPCASGPCQNDSPCFEMNNGNSFLCACSNGWTGSTCTITDCTLENCQHGGTCERGLNGNMLCTCPAGYTGLKCQTEVDECGSSPCRNDAICSDLVGDYLCTCTSGFTGKNCDTVTSDGVTDSPNVNRSLLKILQEDSWLVVIVSLACLIVIVVFVVCLCLCCTRGKNKWKNDDVVGKENWEMRHDYSTPAVARAASPRFNPQTNIRSPNISSVGQYRAQSTTGRYSLKKVNNSPPQRFSPNPSPSRLDQITIRSDIVSPGPREYDLHSTRSENR
ncbi:putative fibropellin-1, partial [Apostichopus japonicus]